MFRQIIIISLLSLCLTGCEKFNKNQFLYQTFGENIEKLSIGKKTYYKDGIYEVYNVSTNDIIHQSFFNQDIKSIISENITIEKESVKYEARSNRKIQYILLNSEFDGYQPVVLYIPKEKLMVFMYSTGIL